MQIKVNVTFDLSEVLGVRRYSEQNRPALLQVAAERYLEYLRRRFISLSAGGGAWPELKQSTIDRKEQRGIADNPNLILRESDTLLNAMGIKNTKTGVVVGYVRRMRHPRQTNRVFNVIDLATVHNDGEGKNPVRTVVDRPDERTKQRMVEDIKDRYNRLIRQIRKGRRNR